MISTKDGTMQEMSTNRIISPPTGNIYSIWPITGPGVPYVLAPNQTLLSGEGDAGQRMVKWSFSFVPPTFDNSKAMKLNHIEPLFAQQVSKIVFLHFTRFTFNLGWKTFCNGRS